MASKNLKEGEDPKLINRAFWAIALGAIALALMKMGGIGPLKTSSIVVSLPILFLMGISYVSLLRWLKEDKAHLPYPDKDE